jgi:hypothetical protein
VTSELDFRHVSAAAEGGADLTYVPIGNFNGNPVATFVGEKRLYG